MLRPEPARQYLTEELWAAQRQVIETMRLDGTHASYQGLTVLDSNISEASTQGVVDSVTVRFTMSGTNYVADSSGRAVQVTPGQTQWVEEWTYLRNRDPVLLAAAQNARCPNCGGPYKLNQDGVCAFCQASIPASRTDWLASAIARPPVPLGNFVMEAQAANDAHTVVMDAMAAEAADATGHFRDGSSMQDPRLASLADPTPPGPPVEAAAAPGLTAIAAHDPAFAAPDLVAEVRELFLHLEQARAQVNPAALRWAMSDTVWAQEQAIATAARAAGRHQVRAYLDIEAVDILDAASEGGRDRVVVRISARSADHVIDLHTGGLVEGDDAMISWHEDLTVERAATCRTDPLTGPMAGLCPACGGPLGVAEDGNCVTCGRHITAGEFGWVLASVGTPE